MTFEEVFDRTPSNRTPMMTTSSPHMRIAIFEIPPNEEAYLRQSALAGHDLFFHPEPLKPANLLLAKDAEVLSVFIALSTAARR